jgi:hypothetical protein
MLAITTGPARISPYIRIWLKLLEMRREQLHAGEPVTATMADVYATEMYETKWFKMTYSGNRTMKKILLATLAGTWFVAGAGTVLAHTWFGFGGPE